MRRQVWRVGNKIRLAAALVLFAYVCPIYAGTEFSGEYYLQCHGPQDWAWRCQDFTSGDSLLVITAIYQLIKGCAVHHVRNALTDDAPS